MDLILKNVEDKHLPVLKSIAEAFGIEIKNAETTEPVKKGFDAKAFLGTVKFDKDPLEIQKEMRDEWE
ncbi:hypothetical protein ACLI09_00185 [Flavobacterium sp. RHBU_24]|uniref:hypothetical protein n=1 Tax=Flavobacterium sp. RHBU_24 TaxID=3391185 RepID=UPI0039856702